MPDLDRLYNAVLNGDANTAKAIVEQALAEGVAPVKLVEDYMVPAMTEVGRRFECNDYFVPDLLLAARAMKAPLDRIRPLLIASGVKPVARVAVGTVKGDLHDIGKNLVSAMLQGGGYEVLDLGVNVPPEKFVEAVRDKNVQIVALSALLTTTMPSMKLIIDALKQAGVRDKVKVIVGGAPISQRFADEIGADAYGESAAGAVRLCQKVLSN